MPDLPCWCKKTIHDGDRRLTLAAHVDWGKEDLREPWEGTYEFHSFRCMADWALERAADHDGRFTKDGPPPLEAA